MDPLLHLAIIWLGVFVAVFAAKKTRLTPVLFYLAVGASLVNLGIIPVEHHPFIRTLAELGIIVIMFALGFEESTENFLASIKRSWGIAFFGALAPFLVAYSLTYYLWGDTNMALLSGLAMTATAVSLTMVSLKSEGLGNSQAATGIMTSAVLDDIASLALVAILVPMATGEATVSLLGVTLVMAKAVAFFVLVSIIGSWLFPTSVGWIAKIPLVGHFSLVRFLSVGRGEHSILALLLIAVLMGVLAYRFGFHPAIGAYMAGLIIKREYFDFHRDRETDFHQQSKQVIDNMAFSWIGPVFFVVLGTKLIFEPELIAKVLPFSLMLFIGLFVGQVLSASVAARFTGNFDWPSSLIIGFGMLGRAELAFVVMDIAYVQHQILNAEAFYTLMLTTFMLNISVPLTIRWCKGRYRNQIV